MTFCQLAHADSLREICNGLACSEGKLVHLGITGAPNKSTLSYANEHRPAALFENLFYTSLNRFREQQGMGARKAKFRFKNKLLSLDSTIISLCLDLFPWATFRRAKGGVKAHVLLDHDDYLPSYVLITEAKKSDVRIAQSLDLNAGSIVAIDRGYCDYALFGKWDSSGVFFVTRLKDNAAYEVVESAMGPLPCNILADELIRFTSAKAVKDYPHAIRRVVVWDPINQREIVLLTNLLHFGATTIAAIYKDRWEIELFFESWTWCTPLDVMNFQTSIALSRPLVGLRTVPFGYASLDIRSAQYPGCVHAGLRCRQLFQPNQPQDTGRRDAEGGRTFTDRHFAAGLPLSLTIDGNLVVVAQRADTLRRPALSVCGPALVPIQNRGDPRVGLDPCQHPHDLHQGIVSDIPMPAATNLLEFYLRVISTLPMQYEAYRLAFTCGDNFFQSDA